MLAAPRRALLALMLVALTLVSGACRAGASPTPSASNRVAAGLSATAPAGALQEVSPPGAVQQLNERLNERAPHLEVLAPADNALLPAGPWTLRLQVSDWPLSDAGELGLGPHLVVQLDDQEPLRISSAEAAASISMPGLRPGSHRVTVFAARPWGEAVKSPGASRQIRLHRVARNGAELPAPGSAQLIAASPDALQQVEPVLIDWLLIDAPLQNLRGDDARWRLRISVNGDSFLVDRQTPLWLKGFKRGSNAVQLELLDGRGDPLNPPFNSVVREVLIGSGGRPAWQRSSLTPTELTLLSGELPLPPGPAADAEPDLVPETTAEQVQPKLATQAAPVNPESVESESTSEAIPPVMEEPAAAEPTNHDSIASKASSSEAGSSEHASLLPASPDSAPAVAAPGSEPAPEARDAASESTDGAAPAAPAEERLAPQTSLSGSARDQVNADGSLQQPPRRGPLAGLREKLGG